MRQWIAVGAAMLPAERGYNRTSVETSVESALKDLPTVSKGRRTGRPRRAPGQSKPSEITRAGSGRGAEKRYADTACWRQQLLCSALSPDSLARRRRRLKPQRPVFTLASSGSDEPKIQ